MSLLLCEISKGLLQFIIPTYDQTNVKAIYISFRVNNAHICDVMWCVYRTSCHGYPLFLYQEQRIMHLPKKEYRKHVTIVWYLLRVFWCLIKSELKSYDSTKNGSSIGQLKMEHFKVLLQKFTTPLHFKEMTGQACKGPWPCDTLYILKFLVISLQKVTTLLHLFV